MKKLLTILCLLFFAFGFSQDKTITNFPKNELKGNALFLVAGAFEVTYERLLNEENGVGVSVFVPYANNMNVNYNITPFYRFYFGEKPASGFFVEGFGMLNSYEHDVYNETYDLSTKNITDFALGFGLGSKWVTKRGFILEINAGLGRNLFNSSDDGNQIVGRGGITLGYRY
jgi:hypothetical protein